MKITEKFLIVSILFFSAGGTALYASTDKNIGTDGAVFMKLPIGSPRVQAMGNTGVSIVEGAEALTVNPAGIASSQMHEISFSHLSWFQDYSGNYLGYVHPYGQWVIGANVAYMSIDNFDNRDQEGVPLNDNITVRDGYATASLARAFFMERFLVGASLKGVLEDNYVTEYKNLVFDVGAILKIGRKLSLGIASQNLSGSGNEVVQVQRIGGAWRFNSYLTATLENKTYSDRGSLLGGGVELSLPEELLQVGRVSIRAGYTPSDDLGRNTDDQTLDNLGMQELSGWAFGIGLYSSQTMGYGVGIDYTFAPYASLGKTSQIAVKFQF